MLFLQIKILELEIWKWILLLMAMIPNLIYDVREKRISIKICMGIMIFAMVGRLIVDKESIWMILMGLVPGILLVVCSYIFNEEIGYGDGIIITVLGVILGMRRVAFILLFSFVISGIYAALLLVLRRANKKTKIPFMPFMALGTGFSMLVFI